MENRNLPMGGTASWESDPDSDSGACGKRKRGEIEDIPEIEFADEIAEIHYRVGEIAEMDSGGGSAMAEEEKTREVREFEDRYGILHPYRRRMVFEDEDYFIKDYVSPDEGSDEEHIEKAPYDRKAIVQYISEVRKSFGFDVDTDIPSWLKQDTVLYFSPIRFPCIQPGEFDYVNEAAEIAIREINVDMKNKTSFELMEVAKAVIVDAQFDLLFLTLAVKKVEEKEEAGAITIQAIVSHPICEPWELHQWRLVKPEPTEA
ncbi:hypothetical protein AAHA92_23715 [Salvia divinorum]|uniref:Uncharacterized protein n=1 Tax=Salvia divinorum TaxID=28513 RepID=A0ABD1GSV1_SALDI